jgi:hypothetical protein
VGQRFVWRFLDLHVITALVHPCIVLRGEFCSPTKGMKFP